MYIVEEVKREEPFERHFRPFPLRVLACAV